MKIKGARGKIRRARKESDAHKIGGANLWMGEMLGDKSYIKRCDQMHSPSRARILTSGAEPAGQPMTCEGSRVL